MNPFAAAPLGIFVCVVGGLMGELLLRLGDRLHTDERSAWTWIGAAVGVLWVSGLLLPPFLFARLIGGVPFLNALLLIGAASTLFVTLSLPDLLPHRYAHPEVARIAAGALTVIAGGVYALTAAGPYHLLGAGLLALSGLAAIAFTLRGN